MWEYFNWNCDKSKGNVRCLKCKSIESTVPYNYKDGNTSGLLRHLRRHHAIDVKLVRKRQGTNFDVEVEDDDEDVHAPAKRSKVTSIGQCKQTTITAMFQQKEPFKPTSQRSKAINKSIALFIAKDMRPVNVVNGVGFKSLVETLEPRYKLASRPTIDQELNNLYTDVRKKLMETISSADSVSLTTDGWSSRANESYTTVTIHMIKDWRQITGVLETTLMSESHTIANLASFLTDVIQRWKITFSAQQPLHITTDNASNIIGAVNKLTNVVSIRCFAHCLNLSVQKGLGVIKPLLSRVRRVVAYFHRSPKATAVLKVCLI